MIMGRIPNANILQVLDLLDPVLAPEYCLITVVDSSPGVTHTVGERLIAKGHNVRLVTGGLVMLVSDILKLPKGDQFLNEFDEMYLMKEVGDTEAVQLDRFPGEQLFENLPDEKRSALAFQMQTIGATMFLSDGVGVNCAFFEKDFVRLIQGAGFHLIIAE